MTRDIEVARSVSRAPVYSEAQMSLLCKQSEPPHTLFFSAHFCLTCLLYLNAGTGYPPAGFGRLNCGRNQAEGNQTLMSRAEITVLPYPNSVY